MSYLSGKYVGLRNSSEEERERLRKVNDVPIINKDEVKDSSLLDVIFAPHPLTGNPSSDLFFDLNADPNIQDFIHRELQSTRILQQKAESFDDALEFTKSLHESVDNYLERIKGYYSQSSKQE